MDDDSDGRGWISERTGLTLLTVASALLAMLIILPYLQYILLGVVLAYILMPAQRRLETYVRPMIAALTLVVVAILAILLPTMYVLALALRQALELITAIQQGTLAVEDVEERLETTGLSVDLVDLYETYQQPIETTLQGFATTGIDFVTGLPAILIGLTVTLFVLFALLRDGDRLVAWTQRVVPVEDDVLAELFAGLDQLMWASVVGNVAVAAIQAVLLGVGLVLLGVPAIAFLTVATFVLALLPLVGAFGVWVPVSLYLIAVGQLIPAVVLVAYGSIVSMSDTYLRPALIGKTGAFNSAIIVVGIFGGIVVFGGVGLFVGPVVLGGAKIALDLFARERSASPDVPPAQHAAPADVGPADATDATDDAATDTDPDTGIRTENAAADADPEDADAEATVRNERTDPSTPDAPGVDPGRDPELESDADPDEDAS
ncbi:AI-2E family transporter [Halosolutus gelatinilyticus]|uniref:AI-2E family transporter n=1 Tax=Halosolutus gelatinilyticus TaxID=2931975 RepID=UPI001FF1EA87|nr:AI-2E family transporter [Halosolutus gelatinilyticus]